jgi:hypothetical protein
MKCQVCQEVATLHITDIVAGQPVEHHVCDRHLQDLGAGKPVEAVNRSVPGPLAFASDPQLGDALNDPVAREKVAAHLLPPLCLALLDEMPEVRILAAFRLMMFGPDARSAAGALRAALQDPDERVRKAADFALEFIETKNGLPWLF